MDLVESSPLSVRLARRSRGDVPVRVDQSTGANGYIKGQLEAARAIYVVSSYVTENFRHKCHQSNEMHIGLLTISPPSFLRLHISGAKSSARS